MDALDASIWSRLVRSGLAVIIVTFLALGLGIAFLAQGRTGDHLVALDFEVSVPSFSFLLRLSSQATPAMTAHLRPSGPR